MADFPPIIVNIQKESSSSDESINLHFHNSIRLLPYKQHLMSTS